MASNSKKLEYNELDMHEHVLKRPDTYIGSVRKENSIKYISDPNNLYKIISKEVKSSEGLLRIFIEIISNAIDNVWRSKEKDIKCTSIKVNIDKKTGLTVIWNDGYTIPIEKNEQTGLYNPDMIFGKLLTGSNYNDDENRLTSGRNGLGSTCISTDTLIPLWNGQNKRADEITLYDKLIGDDGKIRNIKNIIKGSGQMYEITQSYGEKYKVNDNHILTLHMPDHKVIFWNNTKNGWSIVWWNNIDKCVNSKTIKISHKYITCEECGIKLHSNLGRHYKRQHSGIDVPKKPRNSPTVIAPDTSEVKKAKKQMEEFCKTITDNNLAARYCPDAIYGFFKANIFNYYRTGFIN